MTPAASSTARLTTGDAAPPPTIASSVSGWIDRSSSTTDATPAAIDRTIDDTTAARGASARQPRGGTHLVRHVLGRQEAVFADVEDAADLVAGAREVEQLPRGGVAPLRGAALEQPEPRHVLQEPVAADRARLVGEVGGAGGLGRVGSRPLDADEEPGARGEEASVCRSEWTCGDGARRVVGGDEMDGHTSMLAEQASRGLDGREDGGRDADRLCKIVRPGARGDVEQPGRARVRALADRRASQLVGDELGQHQQPRGPVELGAVVGGELEDRVDRHQLDTSSPVELGLSERPCHGAPAVGACAPVAVRVGEQPPLLVEQAVVDRPAVDSDRVDGAGFECAVEPEPDVLEQLRPAPPHRAVRTRLRAVLPPVDDLQSRRLGLELDDGNADGRRPHVDGRDAHLLTTLSRRAPSRGRRRPPRGSPLRRYAVRGSSAAPFRRRASATSGLTSARYAAWRISAASAGSSPSCAAASAERSTQAPSASVCWIASVAWIRSSIGSFRLLLWSIM